MAADVPVGLAPRGVEGTVSELTERRREHGEFSAHAAITQALKSMVRAHRLDVAERAPLGEVQQEAMDMIFHKIGRIVNGNPHNIDSWKDIAGYALRVVEHLERTTAKSAPSDTKHATEGFPRTGGVHG